MLVVGRDEVVGGARNMPFSYRPLGPAERGDRVLRYLPGVLRRQVSKAEWLASERIGRPATFVDLRPFPTWEDYLGDREGWHGPAKWYGKRQRTVLRTLGRTHGETAFAGERPEPALLRQLLSWKAANLDADGAWHAIGQPATARLYAALADRGALECFTLRVGGRLAAGVLGTTWEGSFLCRLLVHDRAFNHFSPGTHLLHHVIRESHAQGLAEVDFLLGAEDYKVALRDRRACGGGGRACAPADARDVAAHALAAAAARVAGANRRRGG